jgi:hypothetical protein
VRRRCVDPGPLTLAARPIHPVHPAAPEESPHARIVIATRPPGGRRRCAPFSPKEKSLHVNSGRHKELPRFEAESAVRIFARHLGER